VILCLHVLSDMVLLEGVIVGVTRVYKQVKQYVSNNMKPCVFSMCVLPQPQIYPLKYISYVI
jgi:hypothetical protein